MAAQRKSKRFKRYSRFCKDCGVIYTSNVKTGRKCLDCRKYNVRGTGWMTGKQLKDSGIYTARP